MIVLFLRQCRKDLINVCGIFGIAGKDNAVPILLDGLESLMYRGYDSAGIAVLCSSGLCLVKSDGRLDNLKRMCNEIKEEGQTGIGHTRWATHGEPSELNSHPHISGDIAVVHNGIIENYQILKAELEEMGYKFVTETDTEVIPHLINHYYDGELLSATLMAATRLKGSYALGVVCGREKDRIVAIRQDSPLIVGTSDFENYIASDALAIAGRVKKMYILSDGEAADIRPSGAVFYNNTGKIIKKEPYDVPLLAKHDEDDNFNHIMQKEIFSQEKVVNDALCGRIDKNGVLTLENVEPCFFESGKRLYIIGCGTAYHAALSGRTVFEKIAQIPCEVDNSSEFRYRGAPLGEDTSCIVISQSGETADTLAVLRYAKKMGTKVLAITNTQGSSIAREADYVLYTRAGTEIAVASTKAHTTQLAVLYLLAAYAAESRGYDAIEIKKDILMLPFQIEKALELEGKMAELAERLYRERDIYFMGRGADYAVASEASLKLKEITYIHSDAYPCGELKHGPIALIERGSIVISIKTNPEICSKTDNNIKEVIARGAYAISFCTPDCSVSDCGACYILPKVNPLLAPAVAIVPLQLLAYFTSVLKGLDVDKPRNLAKSVTVE